ncbi:MAG: hypothetical protein ACMXYD_04225 [Candidatus Woesearchaeota archaeon]
MSESGEPVKKVVSESIDAVKHGAYNAGIYSVIFAGLVLFFADFLFFGPPFNRLGSAAYLWFFLYAIYAVLVFLVFYSKVDPVNLRKVCIEKTIISWGVPFVLSFLIPIVDQSSYVVLGALGEYIATHWFPALIIFFFGWPNLWFKELGEGKGFVAGFFRTARLVLALFVFFYLLIAVMGAAETIFGFQQAEANQYAYQEVSVGEVFSQAGGFVKRVWGDGVGLATGAFNGTSSLFGDRLDEATARHYTGTVEQQQGQQLGVSVREQRSIRPTFYFGQDESREVFVQNADQSALWFGVVEARTFAEDMPIELSCVYEVPARRGEQVISVPGVARPSSLRVTYTGGTFADRYPFDCTVSLQDILDQTSDQNRLSGQFFTRTTFDFQTWGYSTISFMDRDVITALRRENRNPAHELGIDPVVQAKFTPGPISLGMMDRQQLPLAVSVDDPASSFIPAFGVTLSNSWHTLGEVKQLHQLVLQVPDPLLLDVSSCRGNVDRDGNSIAPASQSGFLDGVPDGYTAYVFSGIAFSPEDQLRTIRCDLSVRNDDVSLLLGPDLSPQQFTLVALAEYTYETSTPAPVSLGVERLSR